MSGWNGRSASVWTCAVVVLLSVIGVIDRSRADAATIFVTTLSDKISSTGGCSLKEAIHSANFDSNIAIDQVLPGGIDYFITTQCVPGSGADTIVLPAGVTFSMLRVTDDLHNPIGPTATPIVFTTITIEGNGSTLQWAGALSRAFTIGTASININPNENVTNFVSGTGNLTIRNTYIRGFVAKGGNGAGGGGGGMGAGGAIYVMENAGLTVEGSTFEGNGAIGGNGSLQIKCRRRWWRSRRQRGAWRRCTPKEAVAVAARAATAQSQVSRAATGAGPSPTVRFPAEPSSAEVSAGGLSSSSATQMVIACTALAVAGAAAVETVLGIGAKPGNGGDGGDGGVMAVAVVGPARVAPTAGKGASGAAAEPGRERSRTSTGSVRSAATAGSVAAVALGGAASSGEDQVAAGY